jgi:RNA polymerase subunit RPABC4/transcription elongation factor Spt4
MIACGNCGNHNDEATRICRYCGSTLVPQGQATQQREYVPPAYSWANETPHAAPVQPYGAFSQTPAAAGYSCPFCRTTQPPLVEKKISTNGWIVFAALLLFCFPFFWIGLLMKRDYRVCPMCRAELG